MLFVIILVHGISYDSSFTFTNKNIIRSYSVEWSIVRSFRHVEELKKNKYEKFTGKAIRVTTLYGIAMMIRGNWQTICVTCSSRRMCRRCRVWIHFKTETLHVQQRVATCFRRTLLEWCFLTYSDLQRCLHAAIETFVLSSHVLRWLLSYFLIVSFLLLFLVILLILFHTMSARAPGTTFILIFT